MANRGLGDLTRVDFLHLNAKRGRGGRGSRGSRGEKADFLVKMIVITHRFVKNLPL